MRLILRSAVAVAALALSSSCINEPVTRLDGGRADAFIACTSGTRCGARCVDTMSDAENCGGCGRTCVVPHAAGVCALGVCGVGACESGYSDCNGMSADGCEVQVECTRGASCMTECGSTGTVQCDAACAPSCVAPAETCNLIDDDCDGTCDAGLAGCRIPVHRSVGPGGHFYTIDRTEAACCGMTVETYDYFHLASIGVDGTQPLFRCLDGAGRRIYTTDTACEMVAGEGQLGFIATSALCGAVPLYRMRSAGGDHFYTTSAAERDSAMGIGYAYVGITGYVWLTP
jgi:hypothetical protein